MPLHPDHPDRGEPRMSRLSATALLADFQSRGVELRIECGAVKVNAPKGALSPDEIAVLRGCKVEIIAILSGAANDRAPMSVMTAPDDANERAAVQQFDGTAA